MAVGRTGEATGGQSSAELVRARLDRARRVWRRTEVLAVLLRGMGILLAIFLSALALDNLLHLPGFVRLAFGLGFVAGAVYLLGIKLLHRLARRLTDEMVAAHVERSHPDLDNHLINAILLEKAKFADPITRRMAASQLGEAARAVDSLSPADSTGREGLRKWALIAGGLGLTSALYAAALPAWFSNALQRYAARQSYIPPISAIVLTVTPGDAEKLQGDSLVVEARGPANVYAEKAQITFEDHASPAAAGQAGRRATKPMAFEGGCFTYEFTGLQSDFVYRVSAGDFVSNWYVVAVRTRPGLRDVKLTYVFPAYMNLPDRAEPPSTVGNIVAPIGTRVRIEASADRPLKSASLSVATAAEGQWIDTPMAVTGGEKSAVGELDVERSGRYRIIVRDASDVPNQPVIAQIVALPDDPPVVRVTDPGKDVALDLSAKLIVSAAAKDDFSLQGMDFFIQRGAEKPWEKVRSWPYKATAREMRESVELDLKSLGLSAGTALSYYFQASDGKPGRDATAGRSRVYQVSIGDAEAAKRKSEQALEALRAVITRLIAMQRNNLAATRDLRAWAQSEMESAASALAVSEVERPPAASSPRAQPKAAAPQRLADRAGPLRKAEEEIYSTAIQTVRANAESGAVDILDGLSSVASHEVLRALDQLEAVRCARGKTDALPALDAAAATEQQIAELLEKLLSDPKGFTAERLTEPKTRPADREEALAQDRERAERMLAAVKEFIQEQGDAIKMSGRIKDRLVNDFTRGDEETLKKVSDAELKWAKYFQELATDLSKLPPQDFSLATQAKESDEIYTDVQKAADAASRKAVEMAVPLEQGGLELAQSLETNIEKWLAESPDRIAWKMEDPVQDYDVPLAELPKELENLIGDLLEEEKDLLDEAADATSAWLDNMDKGVGWGAMDGPISDMSAKGVTGNVLPDSQEVGGRSGEGRIAKSSGQYAQDTASGKGGRNPPTRLTLDPYEAGTVRDSSAEPPTGSTGGGKASGVGQQGLRGPMPPALRGELKRVTQLQQQLIDKAQNLDYGLRKYNYPRAQLPKTIELMRQIRTDVEQGDVPTAGSSSRIVLSNLTELKDVVERQKRLTRDNSASLPKELRDEIAAGANERVPQEYRDLVSGYFRALSEAGSAP
jgi:hypothetical protein